MKVWESLPNFIPGAGGQHKTPWFPPKDGKGPCQGALGVGGTEGAKAGLGLGMVPGQAPLILLVPGAGAALWLQPEAGGDTQGWSGTVAQGGDDGGDIWGGAAAPGRTCWELLGTGRLPGQRLLQADGVGIVCAGPCGAAGGVLWHPAPVGAMESAWGC